MADAPFEAIDLPKKAAFLGMKGGIYKVYKDRKDFIMVPADSALAAIQSSGCENIYRIERESLDKNYVLAPGKAAELLLGKDQPAAAVPAADAAAVPPPAAAESPPAEAPKA